MSDKLTPGERAELRRMAETITEGPYWWAPVRRSVLALLNERDELEKKVADLTGVLELEGYNVEREIRLLHLSKYA